MRQKNKKDRKYGKKIKIDKTQEFKANTEPCIPVPESTQDLIPIFSVSESGTFEIEPDHNNNHMFDRLYRFSDVNFSTKDIDEREEILIKYCILLNGLNVSFKVVIANMLRNKEDMKEIYISGAGHTPQEQELVEAYNAHIEDKQTNDSCFLEQQKYIVLTVRKKTYEEADLFFDQTERQLADELAGIGSRLERITGIERLDILYRLYRTDPYLKFVREWNDLMEEEFKDSIAPVSIVPINRKGKQYLQIDDKYVTTCVIRRNGYPSKLSNKFMQQITSLPYPSTITMDITPISPDIVKESLVRKLDNVEAKIARQQEVRNKNEQYSSDITRAVRTEKKNIEKYLNEVTENDQNMFFSQFLITLYADSIDELDSRVDSIQQIGRSATIDISPYYMQQVEAFMTGLPVGGRYVNIMLRTLFTNALVCFVPFNVQEIYHLQGVFYGVNKISKKLVVADRRKLMNGNGWVFGVPGSGKSFFVKMELGQVLLGSDDEVIIIDPQNEYRDIVAAYNGQYINLSARTENYVNPLEIDHIVASRNMNEFIASKAEFAFDIITQMKREYLDMSERSAIDEVIRKLYYDILSRPQEEWVSPTFYDLRKELEKSSREPAQYLAAGLYAFTEGSLSLFSHQSNVDMNNRLVAFGTNELGKELKKVSMLIMLEGIRDRISYNQARGVSTWVYVDEAHELTSEEVSAVALERSWKEVRKQGGFMTGITQNVSDNLVTKTTRTMVANSEYILLLKQSEADIESLQEVISISANERKYIMSDRPGEALLRFGQSIVPLDAQIDKSNILHTLYNTNFHDMNKSEKEGIS